MFLSHILQYFPDLLASTPVTLILYSFVIHSVAIILQELMNQEAFSKYWQGELASYDFVNRSSDNNFNITGDRCQPEDHCVCAERYTDDMVSPSDLYHL